MSVELTAEKLAALRYANDGMSGLSWDDSKILLDECDRLRAGLSAPRPDAQLGEAASRASREAAALAAERRRERDELAAEHHKERDELSRRVAAERRAADAAKSALAGAVALVGELVAHGRGGRLWDAAVGKAESLLAGHPEPEGGE